MQGEVHVQVRVLPEGRLQPKHVEGRPSIRVVYSQDF